MRAIQQAIKRRVETIEMVAVSITQNVRLQACDCIEQDHGGQLAARQHEVADADLHIHMGIDETLIHALIAATYQHGTVSAGHVLHHAMVQALPNGREQHDQRAFSPLSVNNFQSFLQWLGHHHHAGPAAKRPIVNAAVVAHGYVPRIEQVHINCPRIESPASDTSGQKRGEKLWKKSDHIEAHGLDGQ
jgi:hypothetical protein